MHSHGSQPPKPFHGSTVIAEGRQPETNRRTPTAISIASSFHKYVLLLSHPHQLGEAKRRGIDTDEVVPVRL
eukprot:6588167-Pyramimonas_sp.AAC.1